MAARMEMTFDTDLTALNCCDAKWFALNEKSREVCVKARPSPTLLAFN